LRKTCKTDTHDIKPTAKFPSFIQCDQVIDYLLRIFSVREYCLSVEQQSVLWYIALNLDCWSKQKNVQGSLGTSYDFTTLDECKGLCMNTATCVAIDWEPNNANRRTCSLRTSREITDVPKTRTIEHYELHRNCLR